MDEKPLWMEAALTVPETLLLVGTSDGVLASIAQACKLLAEDIWGSEDYDDVELEVESAADSIAEASKDGYDFGRVLLPSICGLEHTICNPLFTPADTEQSYHHLGVPFHPASGGGRFFGSNTRNGVDIAQGSERYVGPEGFISEGDGSEIARGDERVHDMTIGDAGFDYYVNLIAGALAPLAAAHREITRLVALHGEAGRVLALCAAPLGLLLRRDDGPDQAAFLPSAHAAMRSLGSAASATAAAEDFLRSRSATSQARCSGLGSVATRLVGDARRDVLEARRAVERMQDAAVRDFFHAWTIIKRAGPA